MNTSTSIGNVASASPMMTIDRRRRWSARAARSFKLSTTSDTMMSSEIVSHNWPSAVWAPSHASAA